LSDILTNISVSANAILVSAYQYRYWLSATWISAISVSGKYQLKNLDIGQYIGKYRYLGLILAKYRVRKHIDQNIDIGLVKYRYWQKYRLGENIGIGIGIGSTHIGLTLVS
jgi:hypothetical protein